MGSEAPPRGLLIGDAVVPALEPTHDVLTIYDFSNDRGVRLAMCNWVVGPMATMYRRNLPVDCLVRIRRTSDVD